MVPDYVHAGLLRTVPVVAGWDHSLQFLADPWCFIGRQCRRLGSDVVQVRLLLQATLCLSGPQATQLFADCTRFSRAEAAVRHEGDLAFDRAVRGPAPTAFLLHHARAEWERLVARWRFVPRFALYQAVQEWLTRAACRWAGVPLPEPEVELRTRQLAGLADGPGGGLAGHLRARHARWTAEAWLASLVQRQRSGQRVFVPGSVAALAAELTDALGHPLPARLAAARLLDVLRPVLGVSVFVILAAHALHLHPGWRAPLAAGRNRELAAFTHEVCRFYPFFPAVAGHTVREFVWDGWHFPKGARVLLDLYGANHDPRAWPEPLSFRPERFLGTVLGLFELRPHGADLDAGHELALPLMTFALHQLARRSRYRVPPQDLRLQMDRTPALPCDRFVVEDFQGT